jgi:site-specific DNA-cytosine methylase
MLTSFIPLNLSKSIAGALKPSIKKVTKILNLQKVSKNSESLKLVVSTNLLPTFEINEGDHVNETVIGYGKGLDIEVTDNGSKLVYGRNYKNRDREAQLDIRSQKKINEAFAGAKRVHITFSHKRVRIIPLTEHTAKCIDEGLDLTLEDHDGIYVGIIDAINLIKEKVFSQVSLNLNDSILNSNEYVLFSMQLRRLGYSLKETENKLVATCNDNQLIKTTKLSLPSGSDTKPNHMMFDHTNPLSTFAICSSGVDVTALEADGFNVEHILDWRAPEARDTKKSTCNETGETYVKSFSDKSETGIICAGVNSKAPVSLFNEDIYQFDWNRSNTSTVAPNFLHGSLQCCDFSTLKNKQDRDKSIADLSSTRDMFFSTLDIVTQTNSPLLLIENVPAFINSTECKLMEYQLSKLGYKTFKKKVNAINHNGYSSRERAFLFASKLECDFNWPLNEERTVHLGDDIIIPNLHEFRDVSHTDGIKTMKEGNALNVLVRTGAILTKKEALKVRKFKSCHIINKSDDQCNTLIKSQNRQVAESLYLLEENSYLMPEPCVLKKIMGIRESFNMSMFSKEIQSELIGQSVDIPMHQAIGKAIKLHIDTFVDLKNKALKKVSYVKSEQLALF